MSKNPTAIVAALAVAVTVTASALVLGTSQAVLAVVGGQLWPDDPRQVTADAGDDAGPGGQHAATRSDAGVTVGPGATPDPAEPDLPLRPLDVQRFDERVIPLLNPARRDGDLQSADSAAGSEAAGPEESSGAATPTPEPGAVPTPAPTVVPRLLHEETVVTPSQRMPRIQSSLREFTGTTIHDSAPGDPAGGTGAGSSDGTGGGVGGEPVDSPETSAPDAGNPAAELYPDAADGDGVPDPASDAEATGVP